MWSDPIADMLTRIRNANSVYKESVEIPASNLKKSILDILKREGYILDYKFIDDGKQGILKVNLKYKGSRRDKNSYWKNSKSSERKKYTLTLEAFKSQRV